MTGVKGRSGPSTENYLPDYVRETGRRSVNNSVRKMASTNTAYSKESVRSAGIGGGFNHLLDF